MTKGLKMPELAVAPDTPATGKRLIYPKSGGWYQKDDSGVETLLSGANSLDELSDVEITGIPTLNQALIYNTTSGQWENGNTQGTIFGCGAEETSNNVLDSNSSSTFEEYLRLSSVMCELNKKHRIGASVIWAMSSNSIDFEADLYVQESGGSAMKVGEIRQEAQDAGVDQKIVSSMPFYYTPTVSATMDIWIEYRSENGNGTAYVHHAGLEFWRTEL